MVQDALALGAKVEAAQNIAEPAFLRDDQSDTIKNDFTTRQLVLRGGERSHNRVPHDITGQKMDASRAE